MDSPDDEEKILIVGGDTMPAIVSFEDKGDNKVGEEALNRLKKDSNDPEVRKRIVFESQMLLGCKDYDFSSAETAQFRKRYG